MVIKKHEIEWTDENLKKKFKSAGNKRKVADSDSFFNWFADDDCQLGQAIMDDLVPNAFRYFGGV